MKIKIQCQVCKALYDKASSEEVAKHIHPPEELIDVFTVEPCQNREFDVTTHDSVESALEDAAAVLDGEEGATVTIQHCKMSRQAFSELPRDTSD